MSSFNVLVYDDQPEVAGRFANEITEVCNDAKVTPAESKDFQELLDLLNQRRTSWRDGADDTGETDSHGVDKADVIVVDYDLLQYSRTATGSVVAYLLRCFSKCGFIVIVNRYGSNVFDLGLSSDSGLSNPHNDFADLHVGDVQIGNPGLWRAGFGGYRPWYWPIIPEARRNFEQCAMEVLDNLDVPIIEFLGLEHVLDWMPEQVRLWLSGRNNIEEVTFEQFGESSVDRKDELAPDKLSRVVAARIINFLNSAVLPSQNILTDAPHIASRFPSLITGGRHEIDVWNELCTFSSSDLYELLSEDLKPYEFHKPNWLWRPAWLWPEVSRDAGIQEVKDPWSIEQFDLVFCENISQFVPNSMAREFNALVTPPFIKRFLLDSDSQNAVNSVPQSVTGQSQDPSRVEYVPQVALSV